MERLRHTLHLALVLSLLGAGVVVGCAVPNLPEEEDFGDDSDAPSRAALPPPSKKSADSGLGTDTGTGVDNAPTTPTPDAAAGSGACPSANVCLAATDLGSVSGDTGADTKTSQGSGSQWLRVRVTENDGGLKGMGLKVKVELQSPAGANYDLFVYRAGSGSGQECAAPTASSTDLGTSDSASTKWGEGSVPNGSADDRTVTVEVRYVAGTCAPAATWTLTVRGNTN